MESITLHKHSLLQLFQVSLPNYFKLQAIFMEHWRLQPSEINKMYYYEIEELAEQLEWILKEKEKSNKSSQTDQSANTPKMPSMPKMPSFKAPKF